MSCLLSIVIPTYNRTCELESLLQSIFTNDFYNLNSMEVLVIDQNSNNITEHIRTKYKNALWYNVDFKGLSQAKNYGISKSNGQWICFPDDDSKFLKNTILRFLEFHNNKKIDIISGKCIDEFGKDSVANFKNIFYKLNKRNISGGFIEATCFTRKLVFTKFLFDEKLGAGRFHGAEEGYDWIYRILKYKQFNVYYNPCIQIFHPQTIIDKSSDYSINRVFTYRAGFAYLCRKNGLWLKFLRRILLVLLSLPFFFFFYRKNYNYYISEFKGLIIGLFKYNKV
jgi:glycosyltransferase involved in cell wall biosynthesis